MFFLGVNDHGFVKTLGDLKLRDEGYKKHGFNTLASRNIGQFREIPDTRHPLLVYFTIALNSYRVLL